jgi:hypothetical protein
MMRSCALVTTGEGNASPLSSSYCPKPILLEAYVKLCVVAVCY